MASDYRPAGLHVPLITPFAADGAVDLDALRTLAHEMADEGAAGLIALATTGEPTSLDSDERDAVVATIASVAGERGVDLLVGAGTNDTRTTAARHAALADVPGVRASLCVVPYYVRPSEVAIVRHFQHVAERSPVPLVIYNIPYRTGRGLGAGALLELAETDNVAGLKQAVGGIDVDTLAVLAESRSRWSVLGGDDPYLLPMALMGAAGAIAASAHVHTRRFAEMLGDPPAGRAHAEALLPLVRACFAEPSPAVIKAVLHAQGRIPTPHVRMPLADASPAAAERAVSAAARSAAR